MTMARLSLKLQITKRIQRSKRQVFLRDDFSDLADYDQVGRALLQLVREGLLLKIGYGLYAKARLNQFTLRPSLAAPGGFNQVAAEALTRLGVAWQSSDANLAYTQGAVQIPTSVQVKVKKRFSRKIGSGNMCLRVLAP